MQPDYDVWIPGDGGARRDVSYLVAEFFYQTRFKTQKRMRQELGISKDHNLNSLFSMSSEFLTSGDVYCHNSIDQRL